MVGKVCDNAHRRTPPGDEETSPRRAGQPQLPPRLRCRQRRVMGITEYLSLQRHAPSSRPGPYLRDGRVPGALPLPSCRRRDERVGMAAPVYHTADMVRAMPDDGNRYEVVYGELLVTPAPRPWHQVVVPDVLVQPDVFVVLPDEARTLTWSRMRTLLLVAEVLSPSSARGDRFLKRLRYREAGVPLYWLVDGDERSVEIWTPRDDFPALEREHLMWHPAGVREPFTLSLEELFRPL